MITEQRSEARKNASIYATLIISGKTVSCRVLNLSNHGIYTRLSETAGPAQYQIDEEAIVIIHCDDDKMEGTGGRVLRIEQNSDGVYMALYFPHPIEIDC